MSNEEAREDEPPADQGEMAGEYGRLARWLDDDLADVHDPELIIEAQSLLADSGIRASGLSVKQAFIETFFPRDRVHAALTEMADPAGAPRQRLMLREPLPTLDALVVLAPDPLSRGQVERAAALAHAALELHRSEPQRGVTVVGSTQIAGLNADHVVKARDPATIAVLLDGRPYLISAASGMSQEDLSEALSWILTDAPRRAPSRVLRVLTSATRPTCYALRARLLDEPENARVIAAIEQAVFVLCLDVLDEGGAAPASRAALEKAACGLFSRRGNRWYGAPQIVVDAGGHAGLIQGYTRGLNAAEVIQFVEALFSRSQEAVRSRSGAGERGLPVQVTPMSLRCSEDDPLVLAAEAEAAEAFHAESPLFSVPVDRRSLKSAGLSPNAAIQYLLILAAHDTWGGEAPPTLTQAVRRRDEAAPLDWILAPTHGLGELRRSWLRRSRSDAELLSSFRAFTARLAAKVEACKQAPSPCLLFSPPAFPLHERLSRFFLRVAERHDSAYRGYMFRATREQGAIDLITSTLTLPSSVAYMGRPGAANLVATKLGLHILPREGLVDLIYIPNPNHSQDLPRFHAQLEHWVGELARVIRS
jgi:hypothetical protein